jgi:hypothetical protein
MGPTRRRDALLRNLAKRGKRNGLRRGGTIPASNLTADASQLNVAAAVVVRSDLIVRMRQPLPRRSGRS